MSATGGLASRASSANPATSAATMLVGMVPNRTPPHAVMNDPATAPRLSARANVSALPRSVPSPCMSLGSHVPRPYQASRVTTVASANMMLIARKRGPSRAPKPCPGLFPGCASVRLGRVLHAIGTSTASGTNANRNIGCQPQAGDQAQSAEHYRAGREGAQSGEDRQNHGAADDGALAAYSVGEPSGEEGADHHAQERQAAQRPRGGGADSPFLLQAGDDVAVHDEVVAVEDDEEPADDDGHRRRAVQPGAADRWCW